MKPHLPVTLLSAVLAAFIALPVQAVEAPEGYKAYLLESSLEFSPSSAKYWTSSTPLFSGGNIFFGSNDSDSPVALSFKDGKSSAVASSGQTALIFDTLSNLTFSTIEGSAPAIDLAYGGTLTITNVNDGQSETVDVLFKDNISSRTDSYDFQGGAICADYVAISHNGNVSFSNNSSPIDGGAIRAIEVVTISNNGDVSFSGNCAPGSTDFNYFTSYAGAIEGGRVTISNNGDVSFSGNYAAASGGTALSGAIAVFADMTISNNGDVSFSGNYASSSSLNSTFGGAIVADRCNVTISNNGDVSFSGNYAAYGGAIYLVAGTLDIQGNDSVLFEKNYEQSADFYRLCSINGSGDMNLSAKTDGNITFYDSIDIVGSSNFNSDYTDAEGNTQSAGGDIIFSGKYAEQHLNEILAANNEGRTATAEEILNSQTSIIERNAYISGGSLQIKDGAVLNVNGDTVNIAAGSDATLAISDAELVASKAKVEVGATGTLQLSNGASVTADEINIAAGATLALGDIAITASTSDAMVAAYRVSSLNVINADLTFAAGSTLVTDGTGINMTEGSVLTFNATSEGEKINLVFTLGTEYSEVDQVVLFSNVDIVKFLMDGEEVDSSTTLLASDFFTGACINENTTLTYDSTSKTVYLQGVSKVVPEPTTATLSLLALAALAMRRRRK